MLTEPDDAGTGLRALVDEGKAGLPLERLCADLDEGATARERLDCLNDESTITDVPAGIPPLAGRVVKLSGESSTDALFQIRGGPSSQQLMVSRALGGTRVLPIENGLHLIHIVGRPLRHADRDGDGTLSDAEAGLGSAAIATSDAPLQSGAPDFRDDPTQQGFPAKAIAIKAVYDARLRPEDGGPVRKVPSFDTTREHRFRVLSVDNPETRTVNDGNSTVIRENDEQGHLVEGLDAVQLSLLFERIGRTGPLLGPGPAERPAHPHGEAH